MCRHGALNQGKANCVLLSPDLSYAAWDSAQGSEDVQEELRRVFTWDHQGQGVSYPVRPSSRFAVDWHIFVLTSILFNCIV